MVALLRAYKKGVKREGRHVTPDHYKEHRTSLVRYFASLPTTNVILSCFLVACMDSTHIYIYAPLPVAFTSPTMEAA